MHEVSPVDDGFIDDNSDTVMMRSAHNEEHESRSPEVWHSAMIVLR